MGYQHVAYGNLELNQYGKEHKDVLESILESSIYAEEAFETIEFSQGEEKIWLDVANESWQNYHDDAIYHFLKEISIFIVDGASIECQGEDGEHWRFLKVPEGWEEQNGYIEYKKGWLI